jgi:hypothetical protein
MLTNLLTTFYFVIIMVTKRKNTKKRPHEGRPMAILDIYFCPKSQNGMTFWTEKTAIF